MQCEDIVVTMPADGISNPLCGGRKLTCCAELIRAGLLGPRVILTLRHDSGTLVLRLRYNATC